MKTYRVNARLGANHYRALQRIASYLDCSFSQAIRATILRYEQNYSEHMPTKRTARRTEKQP